MKRRIVWASCLLFTGAALCTGYNALEHTLIRKELQADIQAEQDYLASLQQSRLSAATKQALIDLSEQNKTQLTHAAQTSHTLKEFHQKKEQLLAQWARQNEWGTILAQEPTGLR